MSLLEVMVAFVIAALALGVVVDGTVDGVRTASSATRTEEALFRARSRLAATAAHPVVAMSSGDDGGGFSWRSTVAPVVGSGVGVGAAQQGGPALMSIQVSVTWAGAVGSTRQVTLRTERLVAGTAP